MIENNYLIGMDLGTTNIKAIILSESGEVVATASRGNDLIFPGQNMVEQDAHQWWDNAVSIFQELTSIVGIDIVNQIKGICISSQTVTMLPLDINGNPLRNALIWMDSRSSAQLEFIIDKIGFDNFSNLVGGQPDLAFLPNKLLWYKENEPILFSQTHQFLQASSFINYKLTGQMTMDIDQAVRSQCLNISTLEWSDEISNVIGVDFNKVLPQPMPVDHIIGTITEEASKKTGLKSGIPVVTGASDAMASMYATGMSNLNEAGESSGTTSLVFVGHTEASAGNIPIVTKPCSIKNMPYVFDAPINTSGASIKWYLDMFFKEEKDYALKNNINIYDLLNQSALDSPVGSNGLLFFPYLLGERAPLWNNHARGMFIGMSLNSKKTDFSRSIFEGTAFALRHVMETIKDAGGNPKILRITGGGAKSYTWCKIKASVLRMPVYILDDTSGDVPFGDALIVGHKVGVFKNLTESVEKLIKVKEIIQPDEVWAEQYDRLYPYYLKMYQHLDSDLKDFKQTINTLTSNTIMQQ